ncbi:MAG: hypothetical protein WD273_01760 [Trueperaceae bacterium]
MIQAGREHHLQPHGVGAVVRQPPWTTNMLTLLLLVLLTGLPQIGISLSGIDFGGERISSVPLTRSLLLDKLLPEASSVAPPPLTDFPPALTVPRPLPFQLFGGHARASDEPKPSPWLLNLTLRLYRHHSSYV